MSNPGPLRPFTDDPHVNVLMIWACVATSVAMTVLFSLPGATKAFAVVPGAVAVWLWVAAGRVMLRSARDGLDQEPGDG
jgi:protein-S-isoprenylcysteine O-methyltransferase Ste14